MRLFELDEGLRYVVEDGNVKFVPMTVLRIYVEGATIRAKKNLLLSLGGKDEADCFEQVVKTLRAGWSFEKMGEEAKAAMASSSPTSASGGRSATTASESAPSTE